MNFAVPFHDGRNVRAVSIHWTGLLDCARRQKQEATPPPFFNIFIFKQHMHAQ
jgi:hypothetical protein